MHSDDSLSTYYTDDELDEIDRLFSFFLKKLEESYIGYESYEGDKLYHENEFYEAVFQYNYRKEIEKSATPIRTRTNTARAKVKYHHTGDDEKPSPKEMAARFDLYELRASYVGPMTKRFVERALRNLVSELPGNIVYNKKIGELLRLI